MSLTRDQTSDGSGAYVFDQRTGLYVSRDADAARYADDPRTGASRGLLVESTSRTNHTLHSSDPAEWGDSTSIALTPKPSIIDGETAQEAKSNDSSNDRFVILAGTSSGDEEVAIVIVEESTSSKVRIRPYGDNSSFADVVFDFDNENFSSDNSIGSHARNLGEGVWQIRVRYDTSSGENRRLLLYPDPTGNLNSTIFHHAQAEESRYASEPIVTGSSTVTRQKDDVSISVGDWWNPNQGTFIAEIMDRRFSAPSTDTTFYLRSGDVRFLWGAGSVPQDLVFEDASGNYVSWGNVFTPFEVQKVAVSFNSDAVWLAANGNVSQENHDGSALSPSGDKIDVASLRANAAIDNLRYIPTVLLATEADRSAGDPPSLETLTSQS